MQSFLPTLVLSAISVGVLMVLWYITSLIKRRNDVADIAWGTYFITAVVTAFVVSAPAIDWRLIPVALITLWGVRLSTHIAARHAHTDEDRRYGAWRNAWMSRGVTYFTVRSFLQVFLLQAVLALVVVSPGIFLMGAESLAVVQGIPVWVFVGTVVWSAGFILEVVADRQLRAFLAIPENKGHVMRSGLWAYSRHPNYFGEITQWVGIWVMALPMGWITIIGPLTIYGLIVYVSGIPLAEAGMKDNPEFQQYQSVTSPLVPIPHWITRLASPKTIAAMLIEFGPLLLFFVTFEFFDFFTSVLILVVAVTVALYGSLRLYRKLSLFPIVSSGSVILFGFITIITKEPFWIIFKDTLYFGIFGVAILIPLLTNRLVLKYLFNQVFAITDTGWRWVSWNWALFMIAVAISNEIVRVRLSSSDWVHYKMIVLLVLVVFSIIQFAIAAKSRLPEASILGLRK